MSTDIDQNRDPDILVRRFVEICLAQDEALKDLNTRRYNKLYDELTQVAEALKSQDYDQRGRLVDLFSHPNAQVRLKAAIHALAHDYDGAVEVLQKIVDRKENPQLPYARGMLDAIHEGRYKPE